MTNIEANAIVKARRELNKAKAEYNRALTHEVTSYRGIPTRNTSWITADVHGEFVYRGVPYTK